jgi:PQQ-like domain
VATVALGGTSVHLEEGRLFAKTSNALSALRPDSGEILWNFCPYGTDRESIYSSPSARANRVYIGDRAGYLHCLDAESGKTIWKRHTSRARNNDVNSTPVLINGLVMVSTNAKIAAAYEAQSGELAWRQELDGPASFGPLVHENSIAAVSKSLYVLNPESGTIRTRYSWRNLRIRQAVSTLQGIVLTFWPESRATKSTARKAKGEKVSSAQPESSTIALIGKSGKVRTTAFDAYCPSVRYSTTTRLLYMSHLNGVDVLHSATDTPLFKLETTEAAPGGIGPVDIKDTKIYVLTGDGTVHALRHPQA